MSQASKLVGVHPNTIRRWEKQGKIKSTRVGVRKDRRFDKNTLLQQALNIKVVDGKEESYQEYVTYLKKLIKKAIKKNPVQSLYTILHVTGMHYGHWDPTEELNDFFADFSELLKEASQKPDSHKREYRIALVMYCHALEMALPWDTLANTLRVVAGKEYVVNPYFRLARRKKGIIFDSIPPSVKVKIRDVLTPLAREAGEEALTKHIDKFFNDKIRNAFYHSDYCITNDEFRYKDGVIWTSIPLEKLDSLITRCFAFYEAFFYILNWSKLFMGAVKTYHKWPNYEVFEVLKNNKKEAYGFQVHFSNGQVAKFSREPEKVETMNLHFEKDGSINFFAGNLDKLRKAWMIDGKPFKDPFGS